MKNKLMYLIFAGVLGMASLLSAQDRALQLLIQGKKHFWEARFDQAGAALKEAIGIPNVRSEYLFESYLYLGFVLMRQNAPASDVNNAFEQAIKIDPKRQLDELVIPPDLTARFNAIRNQLVGCVYVISNPPEAKLVVVMEDSVIYTALTPTSVCDLLTKNYQFLVAKDGYEQQLRPLQLTAGKVDTVEVILATSAIAQKKGKGMMSWVARGGIVAAAGAVLYITVLDGGGGSEEATLPAPPQRPAR